MSSRLCRTASRCAIGSASTGVICGGGDMGDCVTDNGAESTLRSGEFS